MNLWPVDIILGMAVLALAMPREDGLLVPAHRDWRGMLRKLTPRGRRQAEAAGAQEAEDYVTALRKEPAPARMVIKQSELPRAVRTFRTTLLTEPTPGQVPPWAISGNTAWQEPAPEQPKPRRRAPGDPPTIVMEVLRPAIDSDLGKYLDGLPGYGSGEERSSLFAAPSRWVRQIITVRHSTLRMTRPRNTTVLHSSGSYMTWKSMCIQDGNRVPAIDSSSRTVFQPHQDLSHGQKNRVTNGKSTETRNPTLISHSTIVIRTGMVMAVPAERGAG